MRLQIKDSPTSYGWISILLHWLAVGIVLTLWFIGDSAQAIDSLAARIIQIRLHISIAICAYLLLLTRIIWRLMSGHPRIKGQGQLDHWLANSAHYILLAAITVMLISGPTIVWSGGRDILVFNWFSIPGPIGKNEVLNQIASSVHGFSATVILIVFTLHMIGAFKHLMFHDDDIFIRMLVPEKKDSKAKGQ